jgi:hypothetical protein
MVFEGRADLFYRGAVDPDGFVKDLSGDFELVAPVTDVGGQLGVDVLGVVRVLGDLFVEGGEGVEVGGGDVQVAGWIGHGQVSFRRIVRLWMRCAGWVWRCTRLVEPLRYHAKSCVFAADGEACVAMLQLGQDYRFRKP